MHKSITSIGAVLLLCTSTTLNGLAALAQQQQAAEQQSEKAVIQHMMRSYSDAFGRGDLSAVAQYCHIPLLYILPQEVKVFSTSAEVEERYGEILNGLRARGYSHSTVVEMHVKILGQTATLVSAVFLRHKTDGTDLETIAASYMVHKVEKDWKLVVVTPHPVADVIRAE